MIVDFVKIIPVRVANLARLARNLARLARILARLARILAHSYPSLSHLPAKGIRGGSLYVRHSDDIGEYSCSGNIGASAVALDNHRVAVVALGGEQHHVVGVLQIVERMALVNGS